MTSAEQRSANNDLHEHAPATTGHTAKGSDFEDYSVPVEAKSIFWESILRNPLIKSNLPDGVEDAALRITFEGSATPTVPICWRFAESVSALKAHEASVLNVLLKRKYEVGPVGVDINTYAQYLIGYVTVLLWTRKPNQLSDLKTGIMLNYSSCPPCYGLSTHRERT